MHLTCTAWFSSTRKIDLYIARQARCYKNLTPLTLLDEQNKIKLQVTFTLQLVWQLKNELIPHQLLLFVFLKKLLLFIFLKKINVVLFIRKNIYIYEE